jgi:D-hexose-6-phosphate mutarotase
MHEVFALAKTLRGGVPMATPVFDGAAREPNQSLLKRLLTNRKQVSNGCMMAVQVSVLTVL